MLKRRQMIFMLCILISVGMLFGISESYAQPTVELVLDPPDLVEIPVGSESIALTAKASGSGLKFEWELLGPGEFEGKTTHSAIFYKPPQEIEGESQKVIITITVTDQNGGQATENVTFRIVKKTPPTPTTSPSPASDGGVKITSHKDGDIVPDAKKVSGTYSKEIQEDIWVLVWPELASERGYPQSNNAEKGTPAKKQDGKWEVTCHFGGGPQDYEIVVYTATLPASEFLGNTLKEWAKSDDYPGLPKDELPEGLVESLRITVTKK